MTFWTSAPDRFGQPGIDVYGRPFSIARRRSSSVGSSPFDVVRNLYFPDVKSRGLGLTRSVRVAVAVALVAVALTAVLVVDDLAGRPLFLRAEVDLGGQGRGQECGSSRNGGRVDACSHQCCPSARGSKPLKS